MKRSKISMAKVSIFIILTFVLSFGYILDNQNIILTVLRVINSTCLASMLVNIFSDIGFKEKKGMNKRLLAINLVWASTFMIANTMQYGTFFKVINLLALFVIVISVAELVMNKRLGKEKKEDALKTGYVLIGTIFLIPAVLILVLKGF